MSEFSFSDKDLQLAAGQVRGVMLTSLPLPSECTHVFSDAFTERMDALLEQDRQQRKRQTVLRHVAAVFLALLVGASALFAFNPEVRAAVLHWAREFYVSSVLYRFTGEAPAAPLPACEIGWLPEGYTEVEVYQDEDLFFALYENESGETIAIDYSYMFDGTLLEITFEGKSDHQHKMVSINGQPADFYEVVDGSDTNELIWFDEKQNISFHISGMLHEATMLRIAESIHFS